VYITALGGLDRTDACPNILSEPLTDLSTFVRRREQKCPCLFTAPYEVVLIGANLQLAPVQRDEDATIKRRAILEIRYINVCPAESGSTCKFGVILVLRFYN
jgi:hypothetical protein